MSVKITRVQKPLPQPLGPPLKSDRKVPPKKESSIQVTTTLTKKAIIRGEQLFDLYAGHYQRGLYQGLKLTFLEISGSEAGSVFVEVSMEGLYTISFTLGWKNKIADLSIGGEKFLLELE